MADITQYTTVAAVRAALGVTSNEVPDAFIVDQNMDTALILKLTEVLPTYASLTGVQAQYLKMYSMWFCAALLARMFLAFPESMSDGKAKMDRFAGLDLEKMAANAESNRDSYLAALLPEETDTSYGFTTAVGAAPSYDPVTNEAT
jgi:hypothetical protein